MTLKQDDISEAHSFTMEPKLARVADVPLCVDLDGTLIRSDLLWESVMLLLRQHPAKGLNLPGWLMRGKAGFKHALAEHVMPDVTGLPYREDVLEFITVQRGLGRRIILATASHEKLAHAVANHLAVFDDVLAADENTNLAGRTKLAAISEKLNGAPFDYIGDSKADTPLWKAARKAYMVAPSGELIRQAGDAYSSDRVFGEKTSVVKAWVKAIRPMQWSKNALLFVPMMISHQFTDLSVVLNVIIAVITFSMSASAVYLLNDLLDIDSDRQHPRKKNRPLASGKLPIPLALVSCAALMVGAIALAVGLMPWTYVLTLGIYLVATSAYSFWLKRRLLLDVIVLAGLYTLRIVAGGTATGIEVTQWLLAFSMFMFLSLAYLKRYSELLIMQDRSQRESRGRSYITDDLPLVATVGPCCGVMAVMVFSLYVSSDPAKLLHKHPKFLWALCPILLYWITRMWFLAHRRQYSDDPIAYAMRDRVSILAGVAAVAAVALASAHWF